MTHLYTDDTTRAVTVVIGLLLSLSILMIAAAQYQTFVIPTEEEEAEIEHSHEVRSQLEELRSGIHATSSSGELTSQTITTGLTYEQRLIFGIFPAVHEIDPSGELETVAADDQVIVRNAQNEGGASNYWSGDGDPCGDTPQCYDTTFFTYQANYNHYQHSPKVVYENTVMYDEYENGAGDPNYLVTSDQTMVSGRTINLVTVTGNIDVARHSSVTVEAHPVSAPAETLSITDTDDPVEVQTPTRLPQEKWEVLLEDEMASEPGGYIRDIDVTDGVLTLTLVPDETYNLKLSRVHLRVRESSAAVPTEPPAYLAWKGSDQVTVREDSRHTIEGQVRDRFNNGVSGVQVNAHAEFTGGDRHGECAGSFQSATETCDGFSQPGEVISDEQGDVSFIYQSPQVDDDEDITIELEIDDDEETLSIAPPAPWDGDSSSSPQYSGAAVLGQTADAGSTDSTSSGTGNLKGDSPELLASSSPFPGSLGDGPAVTPNTNSGRLGDDTLRIIDWQFERHIVPKGSTVRATAVIDNTGHQTETDITLEPTVWDDAIIESEPARIDGIVLEPGERKRFAFDIRFTRTSDASGHDIFLNDAVANVRVVEPSSAVYSGTIETQTRERAVSRAVDRFKDDDADPREYLEDWGIPPVERTEDGIEHTPRGNLFDLHGATEDRDDTYAGLRQEDINIGTATYRIPNNNHYLLNVRYRMDNPDLTYLELDLVGGENEEIDETTTYRLGGSGTNLAERQFQLSDTEAQHIREQKEVFVVYTNPVPNDIDVATDIHYQEVVASKHLPDLGESDVRPINIEVEPGNGGDTFREGEPIHIHAQFENRGSRYTDHKAILELNSPTSTRHGVRKEELRLNPGEARSITYTHYVYSAGEYTFHIGDESETITVEG